MRVYKSEEMTTVEEAPIGLLFLENTGIIILKTEYTKDERCECYIVDSGEKYHGEGNKARCFPLIVV